jgi:hypothetical protein
MKLVSRQLKKPRKITKPLKQWSKCVSKMVLSIYYVRFLIQGHPLLRWKQDEHSSAVRGITFEPERVTGFAMQIWKAPDVFYPRSTNQYFLNRLLVAFIGYEVWNNLT